MIWDNHRWWDFPHSSPPSLHPEGPDPGQPEKHAFQRRKNKWGPFFNRYEYSYIRTEKLMQLNYTNSHARPDYHATAAPWSSGERKDPIIYVCGELRRCDTTCENVLLKKKNLLAVILVPGKSSRKTAVAFFFRGKQSRGVFFLHDDIILRSMMIRRFREETLISKKKKKGLLYPHVINHRIPRNSIVRWVRTWRFGLRTLLVVTRKKKEDRYIIHHLRYITP